MFCSDRFPRDVCWCSQTSGTESNPQNNCIENFINATLHVRSAIMCLVSSLKVHMDVLLRPIVLAVSLCFFKKRIKIVLKSTDSWPICICLLTVLLDPFVKTDNTRSNLSLHFRNYSSWTLRVDTSAFITYMHSNTGRQSRVFWDIGLTESKVIL
jgi:hypothetical protein